MSVSVHAVQSVFDGLHSLLDVIRVFHLHLSFVLMTFDAVYVKENLLVSRVLACNFADFLYLRSRRHRYFTLFTHIHSLSFCYIDHHVGVHKTTLGGDRDPAGCDVQGRVNQNNVISIVK